MAGRRVGVADVGVVRHERGEVRAEFGAQPLLFGGVVQVRGLS
jgi:hypothetical protein